MGLENTPLLFFGGFENPGTLLVIFLVVVLMFGGKKIPELMKGLGKGVKEFKDAQNEKKEEEKPNS